MTTSEWPPSSGLTTIRVPRPDVILPTSASITICAPADLIFSVITDTSTYQLWCGFVPRVTIHSQPPPTPSSSPVLQVGTSFTFHVVMDATHPKKVTDTQLKVVDVSTPEHRSSYIAQEVLDKEPTFYADLGSMWRISWVMEGSFVARGLKTERFHEVIPLDAAEDGTPRCEVRTWECQGGLLARAVKYYFKDVLTKKFAEWCEDLKKECEKRWEEQEKGQDRMAS